MHGYLPKYSDINSTTIILKNNINKNMEKEMGEIVDVSPTLCDLIKITRPMHCHGESFIGFKD